LVRDSVAIRRDLCKYSLIQTQGLADAGPCAFLSTIVAALGGRVGLANARDVTQRHASFAPGEPVVHPLV
jgi:hypothetical protein